MTVRKRAACRAHLITYVSNSTPKDTPARCDLYRLDLEDHWASILPARIACRSDYREEYGSSPDPPGRQRLQEASQDYGLAWPLGRI